MSMAYIRKTYGVPARRGMRVTYQPDTAGRAPWHGVITSAQGAYLRIRRDGDTRTYPAPFHPEWGLTYNARLQWRPRRRRGRPLQALVGPVFNLKTDMVPS